MKNRQSTMADKQNGCLMIRDRRSGWLVASLREGPGYRQITKTKDPAKALRVDEATAARICDLDALGEPFHGKGYNALIREPEYERVRELDLSGRAR
ncbi:MAG: hypothetical protein ACOYMV_12800 [Verrucomicrobiia bacterium]